MSKPVLTATLKAKKGHEAVVSAGIQRIVRATRDEPGTEVYIAFQHDDSPETFTIFEVYKDEEALQAHVKSSEYAAATAEIVDFVEGGLEATKLVRGEFMLGK